MIIFFSFAKITNINLYTVEMGFAEREFNSTISAVRGLQRNEGLRFSTFLLFYSQSTLFRTK